MINNHLKMISLSCLTEITDGILRLYLNGDLPELLRLSKNKNNVLYGFIIIYLTYVRIKH